MGHGHHHKLQLRLDHRPMHGPWLQLRPRHHHGFGWPCSPLSSVLPGQQHGPWTSALPQVATQTMGIPMTLSGIMGHRHLHRARDPDVVLGGSAGQDTTWPHMAAQATISACSLPQFINLSVSPLPSLHCVPVRSGTHQTGLWLSSAHPVEGHRASLSKRFYNSRYSKF